jgi:hypothetical protein
MYYGVQNIQKKLPVMNLQQYAQYFNSVLKDPTSGVTDTIEEFKDPSLLGRVPIGRMLFFKRVMFRIINYLFQAVQGKYLLFFGKLL